LRKATPWNDFEAIAEVVAVLARISLFVFRQMTASLPKILLSALFPLPLDR